MLTVTELLFVGFLLISGLMVVLFIIQWFRRDAGIVDVGWAAGIGLLTLLYGFSFEGYTPRVVLVTLLGSVWSLRLALYILMDRVWGKSEDGRYQTLRRNWGSSAQWFFFFFFQVQAVLAWLFSLPVLVAMSQPMERLLWSDYVGGIIWIIAVIGEFVSDRQLARFRTNPANKGKTCRIGLWRYSRHPNYFFEWMHWWAYVIIAIGAPYGWLTILAPLVMLFFLFKVTGIPATEAQALQTRGEDYRRYQETTSVFIPWFPRKEDVHAKLPVKSD